MFVGPYAGTLSAETLNLFRFFSTGRQVLDKIANLYSLLTGSYVGLFFLIMGFASQGCTTLSSGEGSIPPRNSNHMTGSEFLQHTRRMSERNRDKEIVKEVRRGNIPGFLRKLEPVTIERTISGRRYSGTIYVMPDYLSIGGSDDYVRMPMSPIAAQKIADSYGYILPTTLMVDEIYRQADTKLAPKPLKPGSKMRTNEYYYMHNKQVESQLEEAGNGGLIAGHKKDIVLTKKLRLRKYRRPRRVAIYGWHRSDTKVIQPLSLVHDENYADYSHGVRLVYPFMRLNGDWVPIVELLTSPKVSMLVSKEGRTPMPRVATDHTWN